MSEGTFAGAAYAVFCGWGWVWMCCGGLEYAVREALARSGKDIPLTVQVVNIDGTLA